MGSQTDLASRSKVVSIYKCPQKFRGPSPTLGRKNIKFWTTFPQLPHSTPHIAYLRNEMSHQQTKTPLSICDVFPKIGPTFRGLWTRNGWDPFAYCDSPNANSAYFRHYRASHTKSTEPRPTKFCQMLEGLRGLQSTVQLWENSSRKNFASSLRSGSINCVVSNFIPMCAARAIWWVFTRLSRCGYQSLCAVCVSNLPFCI